MVDSLPASIDLRNEAFELVLVEDLSIPCFESVAFKYDILELNTNVKPTFLKVLLDRGIDEVVYLDPDILIYRDLTPVFDALAESSIVLTPHALSPTPGDGRSELLHLVSGVFNLGFVAVRACAETGRFLSWWEERCLNIAYNEPRAGMFVDQKWINLAPCYFDGVNVLKHQGCNMAYWNLHERLLSIEKEEYIVNGTCPLIFFHFSGISVDGGKRISKYTEMFTLENRPDLRLLFENYRERLIQHGIRDQRVVEYSFGAFDNGQMINRLTRSIYAANIERFAGEDPFCSSSRFYAWAKDKRFLSSVSDSSKAYTSKSYSKTDTRIRLVHATLRLALRIFGADRYTVLMKYLSYVSILTNQCDVYED